MATYQVRWFDAQAGSVREDTLELLDGETLQDALDSRYARAGHVVLSTQRARGTGAKGPGDGARLDVAWWCRELRTLLSAGMTVVEALETLNAQPLGAARERINATIVRLLRAGKPLSTAMAEAGAFPAVLVAGVKASERTSSLVDALDDFIRYDDMLQRLRKQIVSAAIYPAVVVGLGALISLFLVLYVVPRFSQMYTDLRGQVSTATQVLLAFSQLLSHHSAWVLGGLAGIVGGGSLAWRAGLVQRAAAAAALRIGPLQRRLDEYRFAKLYQSLALMFRGGYPIDDALAQCARLGLGPRLERAVGQAQAALARGVRVSSALGDAGLTDKVSARLLAVGERTGNFDRVLQTIAERHAARFATFVERATRIVEPLLLLVVALVVGGIVVLMYMPVFDIASSIG